MNIFFVHRDPYEAAFSLCDKHIVKMTLETCQILSTAHRVLDGVKTAVSVPGRKRMKTRYVLGNPELDRLFYEATHVNHPASVWARTSVANYSWLKSHLIGLTMAYEQRYGKPHKSQESGLAPRLMDIPRGLGVAWFTDPPQCMPEKYRRVDTVEAYRDYYNATKARFARWKLNNPPGWWKPGEKA